MLIQRDMRTTIAGTVTPNLRYLYLENAISHCFAKVIHVLLYFGQQCQEIGSICPSCKQSSFAQPRD